MAGVIFQFPVTPTPHPPLILNCHESFQSDDVFFYAHEQGGVGGRLGSKRHRVHSVYVPRDLEQHLRSKLSPLELCTYPSVSDMKCPDLGWERARDMSSQSYIDQWTTAYFGRILAPLPYFLLRVKEMSEVSKQTNTLAVNSPEECTQNTRCLALDTNQF